MIINCEKCGTRFRLDDSRITGTGVKVRCTKCQNVFVVAPPPPVEEVQLEDVFGGDAVNAPAAAGDGASKKAQGKPRHPAAREEERKNLAFDFDDSKGAGGEAGLAGFGDGPADDGQPSGDPGAEGNGDSKISFDDVDFSFSTERDDGKDKEEGWDLAPGKDDKDDFGFEPEARQGGTDEIDFNFEGGPIQGDEPMPAGGPAPGEGRGTAPAPEAPSDKGIPFSPSGYTRDGKASAPLDTPSEGEPAPPGAGAGFKEILTQNLTREDLPAFDEHDEAAPALAGAPERRPARLGPIVAVLIVALGGGLVYFTGVIDKLALSLMPPAESRLKTVEIETLSGFYAENRHVGKVFVIQARVKNITSEPQEIKAATGVIYDKGGKKMGSRSVSPGRIVSIDDVKNLPGEELAKAFKDPLGGVIPPKGTIPVMVLFTEAAEGIAEYGVDIAR